MDPLENLLRTYGLELVVFLIASVLAVLLGRVVYFGWRERRATQARNSSNTPNV